MLMVAIRLVADSTVVDVTVMPAVAGEVRNETMVAPDTKRTLGDPTILTLTALAPATAETTSGSEIWRTSSPMPELVSPERVLRTIKAARPIDSPEGTRTVNVRRPLL